MLSFVADLCSVVICALAMHYPVCGALIAFTGVTSEFGSAVFCLACVYQNAFWTVSYVLIMVASNLFAIYVAFFVYNFESVLLPNWMRLTFCVLVALLALLRFIGIGNYFSGVRQDALLRKLEQQKLKAEAGGKAN
jgi:hypothetical protein